MKLKRILLLLLSILSLSYVYAQGGKANKQNKTPQEIALSRSARFQKELNLTNEQKEKVQIALEKKISALKSGDKAVKKQARAEFRAELQTILTPEQQQKAKEILAQRKQAKGKKAKKAAVEDTDEDLLDE